MIGIALVAMAEEVGLDMAIQSLKCLLKYEEQNIRRAVPLSLALLFISNPKVIYVCMRVPNFFSSLGEVICDCSWLSFIR